MHIPDGLMDPWVLVVGWLLALVAVGYSVRRVDGSIDRRTIPVMGVLAGAIFVGQMINFPIGGGTTGHLVGAALAVALVGRDKAIVVITSILVVQCLLFGDGGLTALGLNTLNMAVIGCYVSWGVFRVAGQRSRKGAVFAAGWLAVFTAAFACSLQLAASYSLSGGDFGIAGSVSIPLMLAFHAVIGVGEAVITFGVLSYVERVAPEMFGSGSALKPLPGRKGVAA